MKMQHMFVRAAGLIVIVIAVVATNPAAQATIYDPVTQFNVQGTPNQLGGSTETQSGANGWYYQYSASSATFGGPGANVGANTLMTRAYNQSPYQALGLAPDDTSLWAIGDSFNTSYASQIYDNEAGPGRLGLTVGANLPGSAWSNTILTWQAPSAGTVDVSYNVSATLANGGAGAGQTLYAKVDLWNGSTVVNVAAQQGMLVGSSSTTFTANNVVVAAGDQIQFWRDGFANQNGVVLLDGTLTFTAVPEPSTLLLLGLGGLLIWRRIS